jgi:Zn-dependent protease with chaperone function
VLPPSFTDLAKCIPACITSPPVFYTLIAIAMVGCISFFIIKFATTGAKTKLALIYLHITSFTSLIVILSVSMICGMLLMNVLISAIPIILFIGMIATYLVGPKLYLSSLKAGETKDKTLIKWVSKYSKLIGTKTPTLYLTEKSIPAAFSIHGLKPKICISMPILEQLTPNEIKAVLIHELAHIRMRTQIIKLSLSFFRFITPFSLVYSFLGELDVEEESADEYVKKIQGTSKHLKNARDKVFEFYSIKNKQ